MYVEQAIFTSARTKKVQGYHLVARSSGIDEPIARCLTRWCPSHGALAGPEPDGSSLNFQALDHGGLALARTMYGGSEYSARGGLQVVTRVMLLRPKQLEGYDYNPLTLAQCALALGHLRFACEMPAQLEPLDVPRRCLSNNDPMGSGSGWSGLLGDVLRVLSNDGRVCIVGLIDPLPVLNSLILRTPPRRRVDLSFTTALRPSKHRPVRVQFLPSIDAKLRRQLTSQKVDVFTKPN